VEHFFAPSRHAWVHLARGTVSLNGLSLTEGDSAAMSEETRLELRASEDAEVLVFDLA
jgi:redox-sensitive bicupin YhaK (pirin superfamily)